MKGNDKINKIVILLVTLMISSMAMAIKYERTLSGVAENCYPYNPYVGCVGECKFLNYKKSLMVKKRPGNVFSRFSFSQS